MSLRPLTLALVAALALPRAVPAIEVREAHYVMGTLLEITLDAPDRPTGQRWIRSGVAEARRLDGLLTSWSGKSALSRLNAAAGRGVRTVPPDLFRIVERSRQLSGATSGAFDVSVGPLLRLWSRAADEDRWPSEGALLRSRELVSYEGISLHPPDGIAIAPGMSLDLGGIGKGYAVDRIAAILRERGVERALVNFGGSSMFAIGTPEGASAWPVWARAGNGLEGPIPLRDRALSTSGSLARPRRVEGHLVGDLIDPRSGMPVSEPRLAVVLAPSATDAEAWSTALAIAPDATRRALRTRPDTDARIIEGASSR